MGTSRFNFPDLNPHIHPPVRHKPVWVEEGRRSRRSLPVRTAFGRDDFEP